MFRKISLLTITAALALSAVAGSDAALAAKAKPMGPARLKATPLALKPDLVIRSFGLKRWGPCRPHSAVMTFQVTVANVGNAPSPSSAALGNKALVQVMEHNGSGPWGNGAMLPAIAPGKSATVLVPVYYLMSNPGHMTADAPHKFSAVADPLKLVPEKNEYNNRSQPIKTGAPKGCPTRGGHHAPGGHPGGPYGPGPHRGPGGYQAPGACRGAKPQLTYAGSQPYSTSAGQFVRYRIPVKNWSQFCPAMFHPAPNLPPCGLNHNSSRTWVEIRNGRTNQYIYGFCAFGAPHDLTKIWFSVRKGKNPPKLVYIIVKDRQTGHNYVSNKVRITP